MAGGRRRSWPGRPRAALAVRVAYLALPVSAAVATSAALADVPVLSGAPLLPRTAVFFAASTAVLVAVHRSLARLLPLAALLELSVQFPGPAPSRYAVARDAGNPRKLEEIVARAQRGDRMVNLHDAEAAREILALVAAVRRHDARTRGHSERVRAYTDLIAAQLRLGAEDRDRLRWAALLHDVGKISIPTAVLNKADQLNESEWRLIRAHPTAGAEITAPLGEWLGSWSETIAQHHEKFDGTGYPLGLRGDQISLGARIVAVADAFDVMTAARSYRQAIGREAALRELRNGSGTHFDPRVVRAMLAVSTPRLAWAMGPLSWLGAAPFLAASQGAVSVAAQATAGAIVAGSVVVAAPAAVASPPARPSSGTRVPAPARAARPVVGTTRQGTGSHRAAPSSSSVPTASTAPTPRPSRSAAPAKPTAPPGKATASKRPTTPNGPPPASKKPSAPPGQAKQ